MSDMQIIGTIIAVVGFAAGFGLGHLRGQCAALKWRADLDKQFDRIEAFAKSSGIRNHQGE
jgi:hypothetical protein